MRVIPHNLIIPYAIDSLWCYPKYIPLRIHTRADLNVVERFDSNKFWSEIGKLMTKEKEISIKIKSCYDINQWRNTIKRTLLNERDKILGTIYSKPHNIVGPTVDNRSDRPVDPCDILIFLQMLSLFRLDSWITYVKMWEIMVEMGF